MTRGWHVDSPASFQGPRSTPPALEQALEEQRKQWRQGQRLTVESLLERHPVFGSDHEALLDLVYHEVVLREQAGEKPALEEYQQRFPELSDKLALQFEVDRALEQDRSRAPSTNLGAGGQFTAVASDLSATRPALPGYEIQRTLGRGGMAVVYQALQLSLGRPVALKIMLAGEHASPTELARFRTEAEVIARFQHPNIVQVYEFGVHDGRPFIALEMCDISLAKKLAGTQVPARQAAQWVETLARAVHYAHQHGIVHRDLKPANVLLSRDGNLKVTDFGMAKIVVGRTGPESYSGAILGTPCYMAPEQAAGKSRAIGPVTDVYGLGAILYEMLTGRPPFQGGTVQEVLELVRRQDPVPPSRRRPNVPRDLETICQTCLNKDPERRYPSALALGEDLAAFLAGEPIRSRPAGPLERLMRTARHRPTEAVLLATGILTVIGVGVGIIWIHALAVGAAAGFSLLAGSWWYSARLRRAVRDANRQQVVAERNVERLHLMLELTSSLMRTSDIDHLLGRLTETTARLTNAEFATIYLVDPVRGELWSKITLDETVGEIRLPFGKGIAGTVAVSGEPINLVDAYTDHRFDQEVDKRTGHRTRSLLTAPIASQDGTILGVFQVVNKQEGVFGLDDIEMLSSLAASASIGIEHALSVGGHSN
jgi:eukaryotic-like serine/threonine-protein kinase